VERAVAATSVQDRIVRTGYVEDDDIPALLRSAAAVAYPSLYEGFGLPALEALAVGAPLVTTSGTAMEEVAGSSALLVAPGDRESLSDALDLLLGGDDGPGVAERRALGLEIAARHTWESSAATHAEAYRTAVRSRRGA
jgi:glycosyltransferase involved in cell wall biosynthesis